MTESSGQERRLVLRTLAMPGDLNPGGTMFGGWLLSQMDMAAGLAARAHARTGSLTVAINDVRFLRPVRPGEVVEAYAALQRVGRSSMTFLVEIEAGEPGSGEMLTACVAAFTMVAVDADGRPIPVGRAPN